MPYRYCHDCDKGAWTQSLADPCPTCDKYYGTRPNRFGRAPSARTRNYENINAGRVGHEGMYTDLGPRYAQRVSSESDIQRIVDRANRDAEREGREERYKFTPSRAGSS